MSAAVIPFARPAGNQPGLVFSRARVHSLVEKAAEITRIPREEIVGPLKRADVCMVRFAIMLVARERGRTLTQIGRVLNGRDHSTVLAGVRRGEQIAREDGDFAELVRRLRAEAS